MNLLTYWKELLSALSLIFIICIEIAYRQPAYDYSLEFIVNWQDNATETRTNFFKFVSLFGGQSLQAALVIIVYAFCSRRLLIKFLATIFTAQIINKFFKVFYHNPRPYYSSDEIVAMNCSRGYGNPSGHCLSIFSVYGSLWIFLFTKKYDKNNSLFPRKWQYELTKWVSLVLVVALCVLTFFSRIYLGSHSLNQTIYGTTLGLWMIYTFGVVLPPYIDSHYDQFVKQGKLFEKCNAGFIIAIIVFLSLQIANIALYYSLRGYNGHMEDSWLIRIKTKCPELSTVPLEDSYKGILHSTLYAFIYFAQIFCAYQFPKAFNYWYSYIGVQKLVIRTVIMLIIIGICFMPFFCTMNASFTVQVWAGIFLTNVLVGVIGVPLLDWISEKFKLISTVPRETKYDNK